MSRPPPKQEAAFDVLDWLYFNQILVFSLYSKNDLMWLEWIIDNVADAVRKTGATGLKAECLKHGVYCLLEILADDLENSGKNIGLPYQPPVGRDDERKSREHVRNLFAGYFILICKRARGESMDPAVEIAVNLLEEIRKAPASVRYRLAERCLAYEYRSAPLDFLAWLAKLGVIRSKKYPSEKIAVTPCDELVARIGLLCEFETIRKFFDRQCNLQHEVNNSAADNILYRWGDKLSLSGKILFRNDSRRVEDLADKPSRVLCFFIDRRHDVKYVAHFFSKFHQLYHRIRLLQGTQAGWLGALGAFMVEMEKSFNCTKKPVYNAIDNKGTITDDVSIRLLEQGFSINSQVLYKCHRKFAEKTYRMVQVYYMQIKEGAALPAQHDDFYFYNIIMANDVALRE
jgi:hypothetical protein